MNDIVTFDSGSNVPAHIAARFGGMTNSDLSNGVGGGGFPVVSFKGKVWHVVKGDERTLITNDEGDPRSNLDVVILKANPNLSKIYYKSGYEEGSNAKPDCYSLDGIVPSKNSKERQNDTCNGCRWNAWGSRISENGAKGKACSDSRRLAIAPAYDLENPMLLRIPAATLKELTAYANMLNRRKAPYTAVVTRIGFDHSVAHPKLTFKPLRWLSDEEAATVAEVLNNDILGEITGTSEERVWDNDTPKKAEEPDMFSEPAPKHAAKVEEVEQIVTPDVAPASGWGDDEEPEAKKPEPKKTKVAKVIESADASLDDILAALDD